MSLEDISIFDCEEDFEAMSYKMMTSSSTPVGRCHGNGGGGGGREKLMIQGVTLDATDTDDMCDQDGGGFNNNNNNSSSKMKNIVVKPEVDHVNEGAAGVNKKPASGNTEMSTRERQDIVGKIDQLQDVITGFKEGLVGVMEQLAGIEEEDQNLHVRLDEISGDTSKKISEVLHLIIELKSDFRELQTKVDRDHSSHKMLAQMVGSLYQERGVLVGELKRCGVLNKEFRLPSMNGVSKPGHRLTSSTSTTCPVFPPPSDDDDFTHLHQHHHRHLRDEDNDEELALLLYRANQPVVLSRSFDSLKGAVSGGSGRKRGVVSSVSYGALPPPAPSGSRAGYKGGGYLLETGYESDSSETMEANHSLALSLCLRRQLLDVGDDVDETSSDEMSEDQDDKRDDVIFSPHIKQDTAQSLDEFCEDITMNDQKLSPEQRFKEVQRLRIVKELLRSEMKYCHCLWTVQQLLVEPLKHTEILSPDDIQTAFQPELYKLYDEHVNLSKQLSEKVRSWDLFSCIGNVFIRYTDVDQCNMLPLYKSYIEGLPLSLKTLKRSIDASPSFKRFVKKSLVKSTSDSLDLGSYLLTPVQRLAQYVLILKRLSNFTPIDHPDYSDTLVALERLHTSLKEIDGEMEERCEVASSGVSRSSVWTYNLTPHPVRRQRVEVTSVGGVVVGGGGCGSEEDEGVHSLSTRGSHGGEDRVMGQRSTASSTAGSSSGQPHGATLSAQLSSTPASPASLYQHHNDITANGGLSPNRQQYPEDIPNISSSHHHRQQASTTTPRPASIRPQQAILPCGGGGSEDGRSWKGRRARGGASSSYQATEGEKSYPDSDSSHIEEPRSGQRRYNVRKRSRSHFHRHSSYLNDENSPSPSSHHVKSQAASPRVATTGTFPSSRSEQILSRHRTSGCGGRNISSQLKVTDSIDVDSPHEHSGHHNGPWLGGERCQGCQHPPSTSIVPHKPPRAMHKHHSVPNVSLLSPPPVADTPISTPTKSTATIPGNKGKKSLRNKFWKLLSNKKRGSARVDKKYVSEQNLSPAPTGSPAWDSYMPSPVLVRDRLV